MPELPTVEKSITSPAEKSKSPLLEHAKAVSEKVKTLIRHWRKQTPKEALIEIAQTPQSPDVTPNIVTPPEVSEPPAVINTVPEVTTEAPTQAPIEQATRPAEVPIEIPAKPEETKSASYPETEITGELTDEMIAASVDTYITWRREHEGKEGVLEPGRADVLAHATSVGGAIDALSDGHLRSIRNLLYDTTIRIDHMQGGKVQYIANMTQRLLKENPELTQQIIDRRQEIIPFLPEQKSEYPINTPELIEKATSIPEIILIVDQILEENFADERYQARLKGEMTVSRHFLGQGGRWLYIADLFPQEIRRQMADRLGTIQVEPYISTELGHALESYTPDRKDPSQQAAIIMNVNRFPADQKCYGGGKGEEVKPFTPSIWERFTDRIKNSPSTIFNNATIEVSIEDHSPEGTKIDLSQGAITLLPESQRNTAKNKLASAGKTDDQVIYFDDKKFRSIDEALGWLVTTPEGKKIYKDKLVKE